MNPLGFLTVVDHPDFGLFGGYLLLNRAARPLEFHCTAPIKPNRAQQILYGPTLEAFLYGEQIGRTLLESTAIVPAVVFTDRSPLMCVRQHEAPPPSALATPVVLVLDAEDVANKAIEATAVSPRGMAGCGPLETFTLGRNRLAVAESAASDHRQVVERLADLGEWFDLAEPFGRIREAIAEAQRTVRPAA